MFDMPDLSTLRLSSFLASTAFCVVFALAGWRPQMPWMRWWAVAMGSYSAVLLGYEWAGEPQSAWLAASLNGLLVLSMAFILAGIRSFDGAPPFARWMGVVVAGVAVLPAAILALPGEGSVMVGRLLLSLELTVATLLFSWPLIANRAGDGTRLMRRLAGGALLTYVPLYAMEMLKEFVSADMAGYLALPPLLADQMLLGIANLSLLLIPGMRSQHQLRQMALRDPLTEVWNRAALTANTCELLVPGRVALLVDVDNFKAINDLHGHAIGDRVLMAVAKALQLYDESGFVARLGGDEFFVVTSADDAAAMAERIRIRASRGEPGLPLWTLSIGATLVEPGDRSIDDVTQRADRLMYKAKHLGRARAAA